MPAEGQGESQQDHTIVIREPWHSSAFGAFQSTSLPLGDRCFKAVTRFVRISFVRASSALFSADADDRGESAFKFPSLVLGEAGRVGGGSFSRTALHLEEGKKSKMCPRAPEKGKFICVRAIIHSSPCLRVHSLIRQLVRSRIHSHDHFGLFLGVPTSRVFLPVSEPQFLPLGNGLVVVPHPSPNWANWSEALGTGQTPTGWGGCDRGVGLESRLSRRG